MQAVRWHAARDVRLEDVAEPELLPGTAIVEVAFCGVCGTDVHEYAHGPVMIRPGAHPLSGATPPLTLGHEFSGRVVAMDGAHPGIEVGTRVVADPCLRCGVCRWCQRGEYHVCAKGGSIGLAADGGLAPLVRVPLIELHPVPDGVSDEHAALAEPLSVGLHAARRAQITPGESVLVLGAGPIGLAAVVGARLSGAGQVFVSEPNPARAEVARTMGATEVFDPTTDDVRTEVFTRTGRIGPDAAIDGTGMPVAIELGLRSLRRGGRMAVAGISPSELKVDLRQLVLYERTLLGSLGYNFDIPRVLDLMASGQLDPSPLVTDVRPLSVVVATLEELSAPNQHIKVLLNPQET
ncbi:alcohol dehydrogenase catalytic domain-containing protein [Nocardioides sp. cx-169]|uniref:zinc-binding dehydrogenase n=1 Tax=Nocardioides sp. cx-169 TaxID=2899080 RepID=UPI001E4FD0AC|nr:zinc-binding dehydrogenase [Nocardioides sp. cx-169]MCD4533649.1 alcohol dehydrogenase catalytic domain-containing protein [Nocardioides sp. cx-169]